MKPVLCAVTDRGRWGGGCDDVVAQVARLARLGVHLVQVRERDLDGAALVALVQRCVEAVRGTGTRVLVNDRVDVAIAAGAHGVHLRGDSMPAYRVRDLVGRGAVVGRSVHAIDEGMAVAAAGGLDYVLFGTVFETASKPARAASGLGPLAGLAAAVPIPVLAIGGMTAERAGGIARAGAAGLAGVGLFGGPSPEAAVLAVVRAFDSA